MKDNPFTSDIFARIWSKHFNQSAPGTHFVFIRDLLFVKHRFLPIYYNYGKTHTKGIDYCTNNSNFQDLKGKVLLVYDIPTFFNLPVVLHKRIKQYKIKQYPGFLIDLKSFKNLDEYILATFKKSSRYKLKKYKKKLETCFDINYKMFYGEISKEEYDFVFESFKKLLIKRFNDKQVVNNNLEKQEWDFYQEVAYPMILEKKAGLFVIYNGSQPIGVTLNYFSDNILFDAITVFDIDYAKFHLGSINIMKLIEWSIDKNLGIFDFSKGHFDYKKRWASKEYYFEYHVLYDSESFTAKSLAFLIKTFFEFKQFLREKNINETLHKLTFLLQKTNNSKKPKPVYEFLEVEKEHKKEELMKIDWDISETDFLKAPIFDFLYLNNEKLNTLQIFEITDKNSYYLFKGKNKTLEINIKTS
ncbi:GNAT family N-acetyltransferase [Ulvibacterium marinum]|uniref:GNAT family N-acetyltransferase n=1 Tax=Ulvibacterium marinum TaxID=2419782 RepID=UPI0024959052|nr:GNAT family N-acetyltransferase [Ulvibacterium marinum]